MNKVDVAQKAGASLTTVTRYAKKHGIKEYTVSDVLALKRELELNKMCPRRKLIMKAIQEAGDEGISAAELAMKLNTSAAHAKESVLLMIEKDYPIYDEASGKVHKRYRFYIDEPEGLEE